MSNPLDSVLNWYALTRDGLNVARRAVSAPTGRAVTRKEPVLFSLPVIDRIGAIDGTKTTLQRLAVLDLVAVFERTVRVYLTDAVTAVVPGGPPFSDALQLRLVADLEMWRFRDQLIDSFGGVDKEVRSQVKQIIDYRNWSAHGRHTREPEPMRIEPETAHERLTAFLKAAGIVT